MNDLLIGLLTVLVATNHAAAASNLVQQKTGITVAVPDKNDPVERAYQKVLTEDDAAQAEVDQWLTDSKQAQEKNGDIEGVALRARIKQRLDVVTKAYETFLQANPNHARARLAYGSFLNDTQEEHAAQVQWEKARELDPRNPAAWNNLANYYGHNGPVAKSFEYYARAVELNPTEPVYLQNFATTVYLFRRDATNFYKITEPQVFEKALGLYRQALALAPENFLLATDYAQSYYGIKLPKTGNAEQDRQVMQKQADEALAAWQLALKAAGSDFEREGVYLHFARWQINAGRVAEARKTLGSVTNHIYASTRERLEKKLSGQAAPPKGASEPAGK